MNDLEKVKEENKELRLMLKIILESHKKGLSMITLPIVRKIKKLLNIKS